MNVHQTAFFYWAGKPLPWLRAQSMATFQKHHPGWKVVLGSPDLEEAPPGVDLERDEETDPRLPPAARSDVWRYSALRRGGLYSDTDMLFLGSIEPLLAEAHDAWLTQDGGTIWPGAKGRRVMENGKKVYKNDGLSIGILAASEGSQFFCRAHAMASREPPSGDYQSHGTRLLVREWARLSAGLSLGALPFSRFYGGSTDSDVAALWRPGPVRPGSLGLHWYGGSPESARFMGARSVDDLPDSQVRRALS